MERGFSGTRLFFGLFFAALLGGTAVFASSIIVEGPLTSVTPCTDGGGYALSVASSTQKLIFKSGTTTVVPLGAIPARNQSVFITIGATTTCSIRVNGATETASGPLVAYFSVQTPSETPPPPPPPPSNGGSSGGSSSGGNIVNQIQDLLQRLLNQNQNQTGGGTGSTGGGSNPQNGSSGGGGSSGGAVSPFNFGGMITVMLPCDPAESFPTGTLFQVTVVGPLPGNYAYGPYTKDYQCGPLAPGKNAYGSYTPGAVCDLCLGPEDYCPSPQLGWINSLPGDGNSGCAVEPGSQDCTQPARPAPSASGKYCKNSAHDEATRQAIRKYGKNLMDGNVPDLADFCPNYSQLSQQQREEFWIRFINAVELPESGCNAASFSPEPELGKPSEGLLQLTYGNSSCQPEACRPIAVQTSANAIQNPQNNLNCGVSIMSCNAPGGIKSRQGMGSYWSVLRAGHMIGPKGNRVDSSEQIRAEARAFPGCSGPSSGTPPSGTPTSTSTPSSCSQGPQPPPTGDCTARICAAANSSIGMPSANAAGTNNGRLACVWAVNQVLGKAGVAPLDNLGVPSEEAALQGGRGTLVSPSQAKCGDVVIQKDRGHTGICLNDGCTTVISNSSGRAAFVWRSSTSFEPSYSAGPGRIYRVKCDSPGNSI